MNAGKRTIRRRSFIGTAGTAVAGLTIVPEYLFRGSAIESPGKKTFSEKMNLSPQKNISGTGWWEKEPMRIVELEEGYEFREKMELLNSLGANMEHVTRFTGTSPGTSFLDAHNLYGGKKVDFSSLKEYLDEAHRHGIRVVIYYNVHAIEISYAREHPEWQQIREDGKPTEDVYIVDSSFCINSPWREEVFQTIRKLSSYDIDGIFYDGPIFFAGTCYCDSCKKLFREKYNKTMPSKTELSSRREDPGWKELIDFQSDSIARFLRDTKEILKSSDGRIMLYMNGNTLAPSWPTARENRKIIAETDILGAEGGFLYGELAEPVYKPGAVAKLLETQAEGKPTVVFDNAKQGPWAFSILAGGEISILFSQTITHQANVWLSIGATPALHKNNLDVVRKYNRFIKENPDPFISTGSMARIALLWPQESGNYYSGSSVPLTDFTKEMKPVKAGNLAEEFYGFYDGLARNHFPFDVIDEVSLENDLSKYDLIVLPNAACLSRERAGKLADYVNNGGNIISSFETSLYSETGKKLDDFRLKEVFGTDSSGDIFGPLNWDYVTPGRKDHFSLKELPHKFINAPTYGLKTSTRSEVPLYFCKPLPGSYSGTPVISEFPFMIENKYGKGRSVYFAATFGNSLYRFHFPEYYRILQNLVSELSRPVVRVENVPSSVEVSLRKKGDSVYVYLINFTSEMRRPIQKIIPCNNLMIELLTSVPVKRVKALWSMTDLEFSGKSDRVSFVLPVIEEYEILEVMF